MEKYCIVEAKPGVSDDVLIELLSTIPEVKSSNILRPGVFSVAFTEEDGGFSVETRIDELLGPHALIHNRPCQRFPDRIL